VVRIAQPVGESNVGVAELIDTHRAENFRVARWTCGAVAAEEAGPGRKANRKKNAAGGAGAEVTRSRSDAKVSAAGFRMLRPPLVATVEMEAEHERCPLRVSFSGMRGDVIAASGPWRSSGEWWQEDGWDHDEWDLAIDFGKRAEPRGKKPDDIVARMYAVANVHARSGARSKIAEPSPWPRHGVYRIFYDSPRKSWFVRGFYD
jgi:hypothetical protein